MKYIFFIFLVIFNISNSVWSGLDKLILDDTPADRISQPDGTVRFIYEGWQFAIAQAAPDAFKVTYVKEGESFEETLRGARSAEQARLTLLNPTFNPEESNLENLVQQLNEGGYKAPCASTVTFDQALSNGDSWSLKLIFSDTRDLTFYPWEATFSDHSGNIVIPYGFVDEAPSNHLEIFQYPFQTIGAEEDQNLVHCDATGLMCAVSKVSYQKCPDTTLAALRAAIIEKYPDTENLLHCLQTGGISGYLLNEVGRRRQGYFKIADTQSVETAAPYIYVSNAGKIHFTSTTLTTLTPINEQGDMGEGDSCAHTYIWPLRDVVAMRTPKSWTGTFQPGFYKFEAVNQEGNTGMRFTHSDGSHDVIFTPSGEEGPFSSIDVTHFAGRERGNTVLHLDASSALMQQLTYTIDMSQPFVAEHLTAFIKKAHADKVPIIFSNMDALSQDVHGWWFQTEDQLNALFEACQSKANFKIILYYPGSLLWDKYSRKKNATATPALKAVLTRLRGVKFLDLSSININDGHVVHRVLKNNPGIEILNLNNQTGLGALATDWKEANPFSVTIHGLKKLQSLEILKTDMTPKQVKDIFYPNDTFLSSSPSLMPCLKSVALTIDWSQGFTAFPKKLSQDWVAAAAHAVTFGAMAMIGPTGGAPFLALPWLLESPLQHAGLFFPREIKEFLPVLAKYPALRQVTLDANCGSFNQRCLKTYFPKRVNVNFI